MMLVQNSSSIDGLSYDVVSKELTVRFTNGTMYRHTNVQKSLYDEFLKSESKGRFYISNIKFSHAATKIK